MSHGVEYKIVVKRIGNLVLMCKEPGGEYEGGYLIVKERAEIAKC